MLNILISGGSDGLGQALATQLAPHHHVIILARNQEKLKRLSLEIKCDYVVADVTDYDGLNTAVDQVLGKYVSIDVLINNAGIWMQGVLEDGDPQQIEAVIRVNTLGTIFLTKLVLPSMKLHGGGKIINIVSQDGLRAKKMRSVYSASKWAITGFTKCLQEDLSGQGIGVTGVYPGLLQTSLFEKQGFSRDLKGSLDTSKVATLIEFIINLPTDTLLPEVTINNINNQNNMDDTNPSQPGLNINPDLMTPPASTPTTPDPISTPVTFTPPSGAIDITPGATETLPAPAVLDLTSPPKIVTPGITLPVDQGVIDITPSEQTPPAVETVSPTPASEVTPPPAPSTTQTEAPPSPLAEDPSLVALGK